MIRSKQDISTEFIMNLRDKIEGLQRVAARSPQ